MVEGYPHGLGEWGVPAIFKEAGRLMLKYGSLLAPFVFAFLLPTALVQLAEVLGLAWWATGQDPFLPPHRHHAIFYASSKSLVGVDPPTPDRASASRDARLGDNLMAACKPGRGIHSQDSAIRLRWQGGPCGDQVYLQVSSASALRAFHDLAVDLSAHPRDFLHHLHSVLRHDSPLPPLIALRHSATGFPLRLSDDPRVLVPAVARSSSAGARELRPVCAEEILPARAGEAPGVTGALPRQHRRRRLALQAFHRRSKFTRQAASMGILPFCNAPCRSLSCLHGVHAVGYHCVVLLK